MATDDGTSHPAHVTLRRVVWLMGLTCSRAFMALELPTLEMFGGVNPDGWLGPWMGDTLLGITTPFLMYKAVGGTSSLTTTWWGILVAFNCVGVYDYANGLLAQYLGPVVSLMGGMVQPVPRGLIYGAVGTTMLAQMTAVALLFCFGTRIDTV